MNTQREANQLLSLQRAGRLSLAALAFYVGHCFAGSSVASVVMQALITVQDKSDAQNTLGQAASDLLVIFTDEVAKASMYSPLDDQGVETVYQSEMDTLLVEGKTYLHAHLVAHAQEDVSLEHQETAYGTVTETTQSSASGFSFDAISTYSIGALVLGGGVLVAAHRDSEQENLKTTVVKEAASPKMLVSSYDDLLKALKQPGYHVIELDDDIVLSSDDKTIDILLTQALVLDGNGFNIIVDKDSDSTQDSSIISIKSALNNPPEGSSNPVFFPITIQDLSIYSTDGSTALGGLINVKNSELTLDDVVLVGGSTTGNGGAIYLDDASLNIVGDTSIHFSEAEKGGGIYASDSNISMQDQSSVSHNTALKQGGAMYLDGSSTLTLAGGQITNNTVQPSNASSHNISCQEEVTFPESASTSTSSSSVQTYNGGGVYLAAESALNMTGGTIENNEAKYGYGGGVFSQGGAVTVNGQAAAIHQNSANSGGGVALIGHNESEDTTLQLTQGGITDNDAKCFGGGVVLVSASATEKATMTMSGGEISGNVYSQKFEYNFDNPNTDLIGGGVYLGTNKWNVDYSETHQATFEYTAGKIQNNEANYGGGIYLDYNAQLQLDAQVANTLGFESSVSHCSESIADQLTESGSCASYELPVRNPIYKTTSDDGKILWSKSLTALSQDSSDSSSETADSATSSSSSSAAPGSQQWFLYGNTSQAGEHSGSDVYLHIPTQETGSSESTRAQDLIYSQLKTTVTSIEQLNESLTLPHNIYIELDFPDHVTLQSDQQIVIGKNLLPTQPQGDYSLTLKGESVPGVGFSQDSRLNIVTATDPSVSPLMVASPVDGLTIQVQLEDFDITGKALNVAVENSTPIPSATVTKGGLMQVGPGVIMQLSHMDLTGGYAQQGGAIYLEGAYLQIEDTAQVGVNTPSQMGNFASQDGGGIYAVNGGVANKTLYSACNTNPFSQPSSSSASESTSSSASESTSSSASESTSSSCIDIQGGSSGALQVAGNAAGDKGGGIYLENSKLTLNDAAIGGDSYPNQANYGGGVYATQTVVSSASNLFGVELQPGASVSYNIAVQDGGGLYLLGPSEPNGDSTGGLKIHTDSATTGATQVSHNASQQGSGGGIYIKDNLELSLEGGSIINNTAAKQGGGVYAENAQFTMSDGQIGGQARSNTAQTDGGGVAFVSSQSIDPATFDFQGGAISYNQAEGSGGGIYLAAITAPVTVTVPSESANTGGDTGASTGAAGSGAAAATAGKAILQYYYYTNPGDSSSCTVNTNTLEHNSANEKGGGIYVTTGAELDFGPHWVNYSTSETTCQPIQPGTHGEVTVSAPAEVIKNNSVSNASTHEGTQVYLEENSWVKGFCAPIHETGNDYNYNDGDIFNGFPPACEQFVTSGPLLMYTGEATPPAENEHTGIAVIWDVQSTTSPTSAAADAGASGSTTSSAPTITHNYYKEGDGQLLDYIEVSGTSAQSKNAFVLWLASTPASDILDENHVGQGAIYALPFSTDSSATNQSVSNGEFVPTTDTTLTGSSVEIAHHDALIYTQTTVANTPPWWKGFPQDYAVGECASSGASWSLVTDGYNPITTSPELLFVTPQSNGDDLAEICSL